MATDNSALIAELARLKAENEALKASKTVKAQNKISLKVSDKGAISIYGLGRFPVTLYRSQMERLLGISKDIAQFIVDNKASLKEKV